MDHLVTLQNFENQFLPNALRRFFSETKPPNDRGSYLQCLVDKFSDRFCQCNPQLGLSKGIVIGCIPSLQKDVYSYVCLSSCLHWGIPYVIGTPIPPAP